MTKHACHLAAPFPTIPHRVRVACRGGTHSEPLIYLGNAIAFNGVAKNKRATISGDNRFKCCGSSLACNRSRVPCFEDNLKWTRFNLSGRQDPLIALANDAEQDSQTAPKIFCTADFPVPSQNAQFPHLSRGHDQAIGSITRKTLRPSPHFSSHPRRKPRSMRWNLFGCPLSLLPPWARRTSKPNNTARLGG